MESHLLEFNLKRVLPDINIKNPIISSFIFSTLDYETKIRKILSYYFETKIKFKLALTAPRVEAKYINRLFPSVSVSHIEAQLDIFKDFSNRKEIVIRLLLSETSNINGMNPTLKGVKRTSPTLPSLEQQNSNKIKKVIDQPSSTVTVIQEANQPSTSNTEIIEGAPWSLDLAGPSLEQEKTISTVDMPYVNNFLKNFFQNLTENKPENTGTVAEECRTSAALVEIKNEDGFSTDGIYITENAIPIENDYEINSSNEVLVTTQKEEMISPILEDPVIKEELAHTCTNNEEKFLDAAALVEDANYNLNLQIIDYELSSSEPFRPQDRVINGPTSDLMLPPQEQENEPAFNQIITSITTGLPSIGTSNLTVPLRDAAAEFYHALYKFDETERKERADAHQDPGRNQNEYLNIPSTSKMAEQVDAMADNGNFNLIKYLKDTTNAPEHYIRLQCKKFNLNSLNQRPSPQLLQLLIDNLLTNKISSGSSDEDEVVARPVTRSCQFVRPFSSKTGEQSTSKALPSATVVNGHSVPPVKKKTSMKINSIVSLQTSVIGKGASASSPNMEKDSSNSYSSETSQLVNHLCAIFPDACPVYIKSLCIGKAMSEAVLNELITRILDLNGQYPKRPPVNMEPEIVPENQLEILIELLPDADPDYLRMMCDRFEGKPEMVKTFINEAMERRNYPTKKEYLRRQQLSAQEKQYTAEFTVENFLKLIPDPFSFFSDSSRTVKMDSLSSHYALVFLRNFFNKLTIRQIQSVFTKNNCKFYQTAKELEKSPSCFYMKSIRRPIDLPNSVQNIPLLQEIAFYTHEEEIKEYLQTARESQEAERREALGKGLMETCSCCYDEEVLPKDIYRCELGCMFCKSCIVKSTEIRFGEGKLDFPCLMNCSSHFNLQTLQAVLSPKLFSKIAQKKALEEIKAAGIEELETCPFCDFATIPAEGYNIFTCMNPECMKESCRLCKEPSHIPLRCDEIEKDEDVRARVFVENKMTEALLRKCWKCGIKFFKEEGCNKMTCSCGAYMCYVCGQPVTDYKHFNGNGGDRFDLCPLYSDTHALNKENVLKGANEAKSEIGNKALKYDPTADVQQHYKERAARIPQHAIVNPARGPEVVIRALDRIEIRLPNHLNHHRHHQHHHHHYPPPR